MQIKDAEKLTGLPAKTIRYYEDKNLIEVSRNPENDYREYSEENIKDLRRIKIFRYLGFSIKEIKDLLSMEDERAKSFIKENAESFNSKISDLESKRSLAWKLHDTYEGGNYIDVLGDDIDFLEGPELEEMKNMLGPEKIYSVWSTIGISLTFLLLGSPIIFDYLDQNYNKFFFHLFIYSISILCIASIWSQYFRNLKKYRVTVKEKRLYFFLKKSLKNTL